MRFCPFCAQENADDAPECAHCGRRLPQVMGRQSPPAVSRPAMPALRPPPVRPLPRPRVMPPRPAVVEAAVAVAPERTRSSTRLGIGTSAAAPPREPTPEGQTRIEASPFDAQTTETPRLDPEVRPQRFDDSGETTTTGVHVPTRPPARPPEAERTQLGNDSVPTRTEDGPTDIQRPLPPPSRTAAPLLNVSTTPTWGAATIVSAPPGVPPPVPLPPPPGAIPQLRIDPPESHTNPANVLPAQGLARRAPAAVDLERSGESVGEELQGLPPMPLPPGAGLMPAVRYLLPLGRAVWQRIKLQRLLRDKLHGDQRLLDDTLHDLGHAAWQESVRPAELRDELGRADEDDERRKQAEADVSRIDLEHLAERDRFAKEEADRRSDIARREAVVTRIIEDLAEAKRARKIEEKALREIDARLFAAEKRAEQLMAKADRAEVTPPEKGGGTNTAANLRQEAAIVQREADAFRPAHDEGEAKVLAFDAPIAELENRQVSEREGVTGAKSELEEAGRAHQQALAALGAQRARSLETCATAEKSIRLRLVSTGTLLSLHRLDGPQHRERFAPIYQRLDELKQVASAREQSINQLEIERHGYDRSALQRGLIVVGGAVGVFLILLVIVIVLIAR